MYYAKITPENINQGLKMPKALFENNYFKVLVQPFGEYQTNCYLAINKEQKSLIIDAGIGATSWVRENAQNPLGILNTHGHFDHTWSNAELKECYPKTPLVCPYEDAFMLEQDCFSLGLPLSKADILVGANEGERVKEFQSSTQNLKRTNFLTWDNFALNFICYPGHTPGCSVIILWDKRNEKSKVMFSGDFIFNRSIGRSDFPYSSNEAMKASLEAFLELQEDMPIFPGHGSATSIKAEQANLPFWIKKI